MKTSTALLLIIILLLAGIGILLLNRLPPGPQKPISESAGREKCLENQQVLENAVLQWAVENNKTDTDFAPRKHDFKCPSDGSYIIGTVADKPRCTLKGHQP